MQIQLPQSDRALKPYKMQARPIRPDGKPSFNRIAYAAAHVVNDPYDDNDAGFASPVVDWEATLRFREYLYSLGFKVAEAMDTAQRGMGLDWPNARELIQRSIRHARLVGGDLACGVGTDQLTLGPKLTLDDVLAAYREQLAVVEAEGGTAILMASRALALAARSSEDYERVYGTLIQEASRPVILHWLGEMFDPALKGYWGGADVAEALETVAHIINANATKVEGIKVSLLNATWEVQLRDRLPAGVKMYTGDDFNYAELIAGDDSAHSHALLGIFDAIAPVAASALAELAAQRVGAFHEQMAPTVALSREIFRAPTRNYKTGIVFLAWLNGHQDHFTMVGGMQSARSAVHLARVFELADGCGALRDPELARVRMKHYLTVNCGLSG